MNTYTRRLSCKIAIRSNYTYLSIYGYKYLMEKIEKKNEKIKNKKNEEKKKKNEKNKHRTST